MTEANARFIMMEIHRIGNYENLIIEYTDELRRIRQKLDDLASLPSSGNFDKVKAENNHVEVCIFNTLEEMLCFIIDKKLNLKKVSIE